MRERPGMAGALSSWDAAREAGRSGSPPDTALLRLGAGRLGISLAAIGEAELVPGQDLRRARYQAAFLERLRDVERAHLGEALGVVVPVEIGTGLAHDLLSEPRLDDEAALRLLIVDLVALAAGNRDRGRLAAIREVEHLGRGAAGKEPGE